MLTKFSLFPYALRTEYRFFRHPVELTVNNQHIHIRHKTAPPIGTSLNNQQNKVTSPAQFISFLTTVAKDEAG